MSPSPKPFLSLFLLILSWPYSAGILGKGNDGDPSKPDLKTLSSIEATAERLLALRKELKLNQKDFVKLTGLSVMNIEAVEFGRRKLTMRMAQRIEDACRIGTAWLMRARNTTPAGRG